MPKLCLYLISYLVAAGAVGALFVVGGYILSADDMPPTAIVFYAGVCIAFLSLVSSTLSQWRTLRVQNAFSAIQTLRTDREYLASAGSERTAKQRGAPNGDAGILV